MELLTRPDRQAGDRARTRPRTRGAVAPRLALLILGLLVVGLASDLRAQTIGKEYQLKAAFLFNFTRFVEWPAARLADQSGPIVIAVLGKNPFGEELERIARGRLVHDRSVQVRHIDSAADLHSAHIVFIAAGEEHRLAAPLQGLPGLLTVGESETFRDLGGIIRFTVVREQVRFEINQSSGEQAGLRLSGQLLKLATVVRQDPDPRKP